MWVGFLYFFSCCRKLLEHQYFQIPTYLLHPVCLYSLGGVWLNSWHCHLSLALYKNDIFMEPMNFIFLENECSLSEKFMTFVGSKAYCMYAHWMKIPCPNGFTKYRPHEFEAENVWTLWINRTEENCAIQLPKSTKELFKMSIGKNGISLNPFVHATFDLKLMKR